MDGIENDDPNTSVNNMDDVHSNVNDDEDDAGQDEDDDNIDYLKEHTNIDYDTLDDIVVDNNVNDQDLYIFIIICNTCSQNADSNGLNFEMLQYYFFQYKVRT
jgi:hypothetical protein